jgi:predicted transcriptional regulator
MSTVTLKVADLDVSLADVKRVWETAEESAPAITFASWELMHRTLTPKRLDILKAMCGGQPLSIRELSRRVGRDFKGVHTDVVSLINTGLIDQTDGQICFPYDRIRVEFDIDAAA